MDLPLHPEDLIRVDKRYVSFPLRAYSIPRLTGDSDHIVPTFRAVVEHIHSLVLNRGRRRRHAETALEILVTLVKKALEIPVTLVKKTSTTLADTPLPLVDGAWIMQLLRSAAGSMDDERFTLFMRLSARRKEEEASPNVESSGAPIPEDIFFNKIMHNIQICTQEEGGWRDEAVYGGLITIRDIPGLGTCLPESESLQTLSRAMENGEYEPFRVRKAAYDVVLAARNGWLKSTGLRKTLQDLDIPRNLHSVAIETDLPGYQRSFLEMMEILSEDRYWHPYLRKAMDIWLPLYQKGPGYVQRILIAVGELIVPESEESRPSPDEPLEKLVEDEWARVPGRLVQDLTVDRLAPLAEVTERLKGLLVPERDRMAVLAVVEQVIPSLERRRDGGYEGPGEDVRKVVDELIEVLRSTRT